MRFNLKLFVLVGVFVGLRDVWGVDQNIENKDDVFIVAGFEGNKELEAAMNKRRVIRAVYKTGLGGDVFIMDGNFKNKLSKVLVRAGKGEDVVKEVDKFDVNDNGKLYYNMEKNVEYTVYFIFKKGCFDGTAVDLLNSTAWMFGECPSLIRADFRCFDTTNVTNMFCMFYYCTSLTELNLSKFDIKKVTDMANMFTGCTSLKQVFLPSTCAEKKKKRICCCKYVDSVYLNGQKIEDLNPNSVFRVEPENIIE